MKPSFPSEQEIRLAVGFALWTISGLLTVSLFLTIAGSDPFRVGVAVVWSASLEGAKILTWRRGGLWRVLASLLVCVTVFSAFGMALTSVERSRDVSALVQLQTVRESAQYLSAKADEAEERTLKATLTKKLAENPNDFSTEAGRIREAIKEQTSIIAVKSEVLAKMERVTGTTSRTMFDVIGGSASSILEIVVSLVLAVLTETFALVLSGKASPRPNQDRSRSVPAKTVQVIQKGEVQPSSERPVSDPDEALALAYLKAAREGRSDNRLWGRAIVAKKLKLSERQVRKIYDKLVSDGRILPGARPTGAGQ